MPDKQEIALVIRVLDSQGKFRGGTVNIEMKHRTLGERLVERGVDASREIAISGLRRAPTGDYQVTVTPTDLFKPESQFVNIPASGFATMTVTIERAREPEPPQPDSTFVVKGTVRASDGAPFTRGLVRAVHQAASGTTPLGENRTDEEGGFVIKYSSEAVHGPVNLRAQVFDGDSKLLAQSDLIAGAKREETVNLTIPLAGSVSGLVSHANGEPFTRGLVRAFDRDLRNEEQLGEGATDPAGRYEIRYSAEQFRRREKGSADIVVKAFDAAGSLLAASPILFNAPARAQVDLTIPAGTLAPPSLFEKIARAVKPLLEDVKVEELEEDREHQDLSFISGETGLERAVIARYALAHRLAQQALRPEFWFALLGTSFFNYAADKSLKEQLAAILDALPALDDVAVQKSLVRALGQNEIAEAFRVKVEDWVEAFLQFAARLLVSRKENPSFVKQALDEAGIKSTEAREAFARLFKEHKGLTPELLDELEADKAFKKEAIADLRASFRLSEVTRGDFSVVKMIKDGFGVRQPEDIRTLAKKSKDEWVALVERRQAAGAVKLPFKASGDAGQAKLPEAEIYGETLERQFREAYPTAAFVGGLERALQNGGARGLRRAETLGKFLDRHQNFELLHTSVDDFLQTGVHPEFREQARDENFRLELKAVQRVFKVAPTFEATDTLLSDNLHSAQQIYRQGKSEFVKRYRKQPGFSARSAAQTWNRSAGTLAAALTIVGDLKSLEAEGLPSAMKNNDAALANFPNWNNLFQTGDLCECEHCRSVLSPAAYFADILMFLKDRQSVKTPANPGDPVPSVKDILFSRRPDLGYIELNCENALTPLPYIDVVCEVLEDVIAAGENDLELAGLTNIPDGGPATKTTVAAELNSHGIKLGADFSLTPVGSVNPSRWVAHGDDATCLLKKKATPNYFAEILRNTKAGAAELRAYPQYVNPQAYKKLRGAKYPHTLPFDLYGEEVRAAFQKTNLQRWDLMRTLRGSAAPDNPTDGDIAAEYFRISTDDAVASNEKRLILVADASDAGQQEVWGEQGGNWLVAVGNVKNFLRKTGLEYNELLTLLDLKFVNHARDIAIVHQDASCDLDKKSLEVLSAEKLDRIHRFLRLWRKLKGWKMWELDLLINHPSIGNGSLDERFLINLMYFVDVKTRLGAQVTIEQAAALFGNLNTSTRFVKQHEKREDALYQNLFLNRKLTSPLDPAFEIDSNTGDLKAGQSVAAHQPVVLSALHLRAADLLLLQKLTRAADDTNYISDDLTLANLSFLYRHALLSRLLKLKLEDWQLVLNLVAQPVPTLPDLASKQEFLDKRYNIKTTGLSEADVDKILLKVSHRDVLDFAAPQSALEFLEKVGQLKASGFTPDELNWVLAADRSSKAATKEEEAARFLAALRQELKSIHAENDPAQYDFLNVAAPADEERLTALLTALLQKLNRSEAEVGFFLVTLRGGVRLEAEVQGLPSGFVFDSSITAAPHHIPIEYDETSHTLRFTGLMTGAQRTTLLTDASLSAVTNNPAYKSAVEELFQRSQSAITSYASMEVDAVLPAGVTLPPDRPSLPIRYNSTTQKLGFVGVMTEDERTALVTAGYPAAAVEELFQLPRRAIKFFAPAFVAPLSDLPATLNFKQLPDELAAKIDYDAEQRLLRFKGIMREEERAALDDLVPDLLPSEAAYHNAVESLATQPQTIAPPDERIWLMDADLDATQPANDTLAKRMANASTKALGYLSKTLAANHVIQRSAAQLGLTEALARRLTSDYAVLPVPSSPTKTALLPHLTNAFAETDGAVSYATLKSTFDGWFWATRAAMLLKKWKLTLEEFERLSALTVAAQLLDLLSLPLNETEPLAPTDRFLRTGRLLKMRESLPETGITLLEVLEKLNGGVYAAAAIPPVTAVQLFAADVVRLNEDWPAADVEALVSSLDLLFPSDYLLPQSWERLRRAFYFMEKLNAGPATVQSFAAAAMNETHTKTLKELLRSKLGAETWLTLSAEIQDVLRERKRDALAAYLLAAPQPEGVPSGKWENTSDLYAYYLLDIEMSACQLTSRLVQASGSVQLFVQRCFMGLEPDVRIKDDSEIAEEDKPLDAAAEDDDASAWRWWKWMRKYRVWEANRKVFLWPENWIEPELRKDKSQFFKELEDELLQNEINQYTVEAALENYLEKLDGVAQLEIAGFFQEDDGEDAILHVFGRTTGTEPHLYYYRRYDYRQWTPWEKVELEIQGDYLIPVVVNKRLFLFFPVFKEVQDEQANSTVNVPNLNQQAAPVPKVKKKLRLQMAVSDYRQGKWSPKKVSKEFDESGTYDVEIENKYYIFLPVDRSEVDGRFGIIYGGWSADKQGTAVAAMEGGFEISGCKGVPIKAHFPDAIFPFVRPELESTGNLPTFMKWVELGNRFDKPHNDFSLQTLSDTQSDLTPPAEILRETPGLFRMSPPWHMSYFDKLQLDGQMLLPIMSSRIPVPTGTWLPFFYNDKHRTFFALPSLNSERNEKGESTRSYYPAIKAKFQELEEYFRGVTKALLEDTHPDSWNSDQKALVNFILSQQFPGEPQPFTNKQIVELLGRYYMRIFHFYLSLLSWYMFKDRKFHFKNFYHPFVCDFAKMLYNPLQGIPALMSRKTQLKDTGFNFDETYQPTFSVVEPGTDKHYPKEDVDFSPDGAYAPYNWELFFHAPLLIANALSKNQRFEEARDWYHFIFNPLGIESAQPGGSPMSKYWITKPFFETTDPQYVQQRIDNILRMLAGNANLPDSDDDAKKALEAQVKDWRTNPFEPHRIANYRTAAYQKTVVMKYLDNLIAWGDNLFRQDSMESINEATQLYILAAEILGPRPKKVPPQAKPPVETFNELEEKFDAFSNELVAVENLVPQLPGDAPEGTGSVPLPQLYFCIPHNEKMLGYWETVADRLYKIRHCMNIEGVVRQLALFEPPIDPAALVKAVAGGVDISAAIADLNAPLPLYRFHILLQKAQEVCNDVKALGGALLGALEKKDAEAMSRLRQSQEIRVLEAVTAVKEKQLEEAKENLAGILKSKAVVQTRRDYYHNIEQLSAQERLHLDKMKESHSKQKLAQEIKIGAATISYLPAINLGASGFGGSPLASFKIGGLELGQAASFASEVLSVLSAMASAESSMASSTASFDRRWNDWKFQESLAEKELEQLDRQIAAADLRVKVAEKELENHAKQIENAKEVDSLMRSKYTNEELYRWQLGEISGVYFQSYRLAYDLAKRAERCFRFELGLQDSSFINFGYWDSLKRGLLSGDKLQYDLRRLETAYLEQNRREFELSKHISLALLDPLSLVKLRETGRCFFRIPEELFDLDYPGHYFRRIKSVSITLPCVVGPYTTISCTLRLLKNSVRISASPDTPYARNADQQGLPAEDGRFIENNIPVKAIAASHAQNDSGMFELSFRDERYLPFEGAGAISEWSLELFNDLPSNNPDPAQPDFGKALRQFDYGTITDAVVHLKYTAREDAGQFKNSAIAHLRDYLTQDGATPSLRLLNLRQEFPSQWHRFLNPTAPAGANVFEFEMSPALFPIRDMGKTLKVNTIWLLARCTSAEDYGVKLSPPLPAGDDTVTLSPSNQYGGLHFSQKEVALQIAPTEPFLKWQLTMTRQDGGNLQQDPVSKFMEVEDVMLVLGYEWA